MILVSKYERVILWGVKEENKYLYADLGYFANNMRRDTIELFEYRKRNPKKYIIKMLPQLLNQRSPSASARLLLPMVK